MRRRLHSQGARLPLARGIALAVALGLVGCATTPSVVAPPESSGVPSERVDDGSVEAPSSSGVAPSEAIPSFETPGPASEPPLTASAALGRYDARRDASLRLVIAGLEADAVGDAARALASYQRAVRLDATNPIAFLALARHHVAVGDPEEASAFLDQARALFESEGELGPAVDVWGLGLRAWIDRAEGRDADADARFEAARRLAPEIWGDELLSADELK
ncbi:MAG: tetratricopeptide repeat protein [Myxococcota bacterium]